MNLLLSFPILATASAAAQNQPPVLFDNKGLALFAILAGVAVFIGLVALVGRLLAATHPDAPATAKAAAPTKAAATPAPAEADAVTPEVLAAIAASIFVTLGPKAKIAEIRTPAPSVEALMQMWALEGRRQIYTSHNLR
ncbi:hypothetical protein OH491_17630 [Termitidicoccus mucosus]|uniref:Oxaloacetate decarboxylase gamma chain n=1 Tax=Termitidicoccus mucosus TaxID=1184151 RepID=A0A178IL36_9BACT|nr:hypothetical protein AW736_10970 [Opitutaceae bacterium TSB47]